MSPAHAGTVRADSLGLSNMELGKKMYREGKLPNGQTLRAVGAGKAPIIGTLITCINCHRRSGLGTIEVKNRAPPITGEILFQQRAQSYR